MFVLSKKASFSWPVKIKVPVDNGKHEEKKISLVFKYMTKSALKELINTAKSDDEFCKEIIVGWKDVQDESGNPLEFSAENLALVLDIPAMDKAIAEAYLKSYDQAATKN